VGIKIISENKKARFDYEILDTMEAGLVLMGSEVKSLRNGQVQLKDSYVGFRGHEAFLQKAHISEYKASSYNNHEPERPRKLLMHSSELVKLASQVQEKGLTCVPLKIYFKDGVAKIQIGIARGKKLGDKRASAKKRDAQREIESRVQRDRRR
jgi:SsrA-binding protein